MTSALSKTGTIVALASAAGRAGVAVVRVSGEQAAEAITKLCKLALLPPPRTATLCDIHDFRTNDLIDRALVLWFPAPHSFTGENIVEFHVHGGRAILHALLEALCALENFRLAEAGEFSRRAFENGKMDLTEAEGIADLVDAETAAQRRQALRQMDGELGRLYTNWAARLTHALAFMEAAIDFSDEEIPDNLAAQSLADIKTIVDEMTTHLNDAHRGERLREGFVVAILGAPNAGKSSLLNALARREAAIVSPTAGTTRDIIEIQLDLGGFPVSLVDTAGLRESVDEIESEGVRRALARAEQADLKLLLFDGSAEGPPDPATLSLLDDRSLVVMNKADLMERSLTKKNIVIPAKAGIQRAASAAHMNFSPRGCAALDPALRRGDDTEKPLPISAKTGEGLAELTACLIHEIETRFTCAAGPALTRGRHRAALEDCLAHLRRALDVKQTELCAEDLRLSVRALGRITGTVDVEDLLDVIFGSFCIGK